MCDRGSREFKFDDYSLTKECLRDILKRFPTVTIDAMASSTNCVVERFFSKIPSLNCLRVDIFCQTLCDTEFYYVFPPVGLGVKVLKFLASQKVKGIFLIPIWSKSNWFNFFFEDGRHCSEWVVKMHTFSPNFCYNISTSSCFSEFVSYEMAALEFNFEKFCLGSGLKVSQDFCLKEGCQLCY